MKKIFDLLLNRITIVCVLLAAEMAMLLLLLLQFQEYSVYFSIVAGVFSLLIVVYVVNSRSNPAYQLAWCIVILAVPIFGGVFYLLFGGNKRSAVMRRVLKNSELLLRRYLPRDDPVLASLAQSAPAAARQAEYLSRCAACAPHRNTTVEFFPLGENKFVRLKEELEKAEHFIFLEYFIVQEGVMWNSILEILERKAAAGVDVRMIYDDVGCLTTLPYGYHETLEKKGIRCCVFNPFVPVLSACLNNRDHRKIVVIDGHTGFTGGINLADEYINVYEKHGHWKDCAVMLKGEAVWNLTLMFIAMWNSLRPQDKLEAPEAYRPDRWAPLPALSDGVVQPYADNPSDEEPVGENVYLGMIGRATRYVYIDTPYLIIDHEMATALQNAAKSGVDVRIVTPHVPDKRAVHAVTRAHYGQLLESGVRIFEYTPGFVHAKIFAVDDEYATVGTINLDFRSLYLHFECGVWMYRCSVIRDIVDDYRTTLEKCQEITLEDWNRRPWYHRLAQAFLRLFAPLM